MSTVNFLTEVFQFEITDSGDFKKPQEDAFQQTYDSMFYTEIPLIQDITIFSIIVIIGLVLNALILRCYWKIRNDIALYIKAFAVFDILMLLYSTFMKIAQYFMASNLSLNVLILKGFNFMAIHIMIGPLFLALDCFLIVVFPHKFKLHQSSRRCRSSKARGSC